VPKPTGDLLDRHCTSQSADQQCGKFVYADMHLYGGDVQDPATALPDDGFPTTCGATLTPEEKALAFLFFDLSSCIQDDTKPPAPPLIIK
jgi:hypothetical protein